MKYINNEAEDFFLQRFSMGLRNILRFKQYFDKCSWCKTMALTIIYAICAKARLPIDALFAILSGIIEAIENIMNIANEVTKNLLNYLENVNQRFTPFQLARMICRSIGYCFE